MFSYSGFVLVRVGDKCGRSSHLAPDAVVRHVTVDTLDRVNPSFGSKLYLVILALSRRVKLRDPEVITLRMNTRNNP